MDFFSQERLIVSNKPESITYPGQVFDWQMSVPLVRLFYHHRGLAKAPLEIQLWAINRDQETATMSYIQSKAGPSLDYVFTGHLALSQFFGQLNQAPQMVTIPGKHKVQLLAHPLKYKQSSSGIIQLKLSQQENIRLVMVVANDEYPQIIPLLDQSIHPEPFEAYFFRHAKQQIVKQFSVGTQDDKIRVGGPPYIKDMQYQKPLKGNYGLLYDIQVELSNPLPQPADVQILVAPHQQNSIDRGVFLLDGKLKELGIITYKDQTMIIKELASYSLPPFESRRISLKTMPQAGSFYPIDLIFKYELN